MTSVHETIGNALARMSGRKIVVVGDIMLDRFIHGSVGRISPEAPVPILCHEGEHNMPGGAANVARNLAHLGIGVTLIGVVGKDQHADILANAIMEEPAISYHPLAAGDRMTTVKTRFTSSGQQILRVDEENKQPIPKSMHQRLIKLVERALKSADVLIISDYDKGIIDHNTAQAMIKLARKAGIRIIADPKKPDPAIYRGTSLMTPNLGELKNMTSLTANAVSDIGSAALGLVKSNKMDAMLVTLGPEGMMYVEKNKPPQHAASIAKAVYDVSGAGDTVIASFAAALAGGATSGEAMMLANTAAGLVVGKSGTATAMPGEILAEIAPRYTKTEQDILSLAEDWRKKRMKIGFTNGCFDQLHPGHIHVLEKAAATCSRLIVGLNSDKSARKLKGPMRPLQSEGRRAAVLASMPMVDGVIIFDEPTPAQLISAITPDVLIKGGEYKADKVIGAKHVRDHGGKVVIVPMRAGFSTTRLSGE
jgi:D-beta-D-heptose 7-phosphate kinase/D-beta-D-heptose 1-phosphate adenosyltransferase